MGCSANSITESASSDVINRPVEFVDASGTTVQLEAFPQRIVIEGRLTQMIVDFYYLFRGQDKKIVGIENRLQTVEGFINIVDPHYQNKLVIEQDATAEQVAGLNPDLVIMKSALKNKIGSTFTAIEIPVVYMDFENPSQINREITNLGWILNQPTRAREINELFAIWEESVTDVTNTLRIDQKPTILLLQITKLGDEMAFDVPPADWLQTSLVELAGGIPVWKESIVSGSWMKVGFEQIAAWNPDFIFIINYFGNSAESVNTIKANPTWQGLTSVKTDRLFGFAGDFLSWDQPDPRWVLGLKWLGNKIHPEIIQFDFQRDIPKFFKEFYGISYEEYSSQIKPVLKGNF